MDLDFLVSWINDHGIQIGIILVGIFILERFGMVPLEGFIRRSIKTNRFTSETERQKREETLLDISRGAFRILVWIVAILLILIELNVNVQPFIAGAGIVGIALGFGAQNILKDIFTGIFIITENQYQVGDVVGLDGDVGMVEDISLRMTVLRDLDGTVHHIPHGTVNRARNLSKSYARVNLNVGVSYNSDLERVKDIVNRVGKELTADKEWKHKIISPPLFLRVDNFSDSAIEIKIIGETKPLQHWAVTGELRLRLKEAFDKEGIEIPFPQRVVHHPEAKS